MPRTFTSAWQFMDLADFLTWKATASLTRSACTVTCKWTYLAHESRWDEGYFRRVGLGQLADESFCQIDPLDLPGRGRERLTRLADELDRAPIEAHHWPHRIWHLSI
jgi:hypothetical protein